MLIREQKMKRQLLAAKICMVCLLTLIITIHFLRPRETYGCIIQWIDTANNKVSLRIEGLCRDNSKDNHRNMWYETTFYNIEVETVE